jgi:hypothetical protein
MFTCNICNYNFKKKQSLQIHLNEKRCKSHLLSDLYQLHLYIGKLKIDSLNALETLEENHNIYIQIKKNHKKIETSDAPSQTLSTII